jgi:hypothetical protein
VLFLQGKVIKHFTDKDTLKSYHEGDLYETDSKERLQYLVDLDYLENIKVETEVKQDKPKKRKK